MKCLLWLTNINISTDNWVSATIFNLITGKYLLNFNKISIFSNFHAFVQSFS